jgi:hypothetical protein
VAVWQRLGYHNGRMAKKNEHDADREPPGEQKPAGNTSPPIGRRYEQLISIRQPQAVSLIKGWVQPISIRQAQVVSILGRFSRLVARAGGMVRAAVARLPRGRPREYDHEAITDVAENLARETGVDDHLDPFFKRVRDECKNKRPRHKTPGRTQMREICRPIWEAHRAQTAKKN